MINNRGSVDSYHMHHPCQHLRAAHLPPASCSLSPTSSLLLPTPCLLPPASYLLPTTSYRLPPDSYVVKYIRVMIDELSCVARID